MKLYVYNPYTNNTVADDYIDTIEKAFIAAGYDTEKIATLEKRPKGNDDSVLVVAVKDATEAKRKGYGKVLLWIQGIIPEESYMRNHSRIRSLVFSIIEKRGIKDADFVFLVSDAMHEHYLAKYKIDIKDYYVMPCFNAQIETERFEHAGKYESNLFLYAGGLDAWQCFEETVALYKRIESEVPSASLRVLTKNKEEALRVINENGVKNYSIDFRPLDKMPEELEAAKFGFSLRKSHPVNHVSTPTKLSSYVSCGVIPIYSRHICDFAKRAKDMTYAVAADPENDYGFEKIIALCNKSINSGDVVAEYVDKFGEYYSKDYHINRIAEILRKR